VFATVWLKYQVGQLQALAFHGDKLIGAAFEPQPKPLDYAVYYTVLRPTPSYYTVRTDFQIRYDYKWLYCIIPYLLYYGSGDANGYTIPTLCIGVRTEQVPAHLLHKKRSWRLTAKYNKQQISRGYNRHRVELEVSQPEHNNKSLEVQWGSDKPGWLHIGSKRHRAQKDLPNGCHPSDDVWLFGMVGRSRTWRRVHKTDY
jgi:hypothetical protein